MPPMKRCPHCKKFMPMRRQAIGRANWAVYICKNWACPNFTGRGYQHVQWLALPPDRNKAVQ